MAGKLKFAGLHAGTGWRSTLEIGATDPVNRQPRKSTRQSVCKLNNPKHPWKQFNVLLLGIAEGMAICKANGKFGKFW